MSAGATTRPASVLRGNRTLPAGFAGHPHAAVGWSSSATAARAATISQVTKRPSIAHGVDGATW